MTFTFTMDAFPGYTYFNKTRQVLCAIQTIEDSVAGSTDIETVFPHEEGANDPVNVEGLTNTATDADDQIADSVPYTVSG